jgi:hypothetical protein
MVLDEFDPKLRDFSLFCLGIPEIVWTFLFKQNSFQRTNPMSLTGGKSRLWHKVKADSGLGLPNVPMANVLKVDPALDIR